MKTRRIPTHGDASTDLLEVERVDITDTAAHNHHIAPALEAPQVLSMSYDDQMLVLGRRDGSLLQLSFDTTAAEVKAMSHNHVPSSEWCGDPYTRPHWVK